MTAEIIYRVFVSSTYEDLREERAEVQKGLLKVRCLPIGMELFPSADEETWEFVKRQIDQSDYYVVVIAGRYGSLASDGRSFTEKEYDYAREIKKPTLAFLHADRDRIEVGKTDPEQDKREKLDAFIEKVKSSALVNWFRTAHELGGQVALSIMDLKDRRPAVGFVRADQAVDYKKYAELLEENARLKNELSAIASAQGHPFRGAGDSVRVVLQVSSTSQKQAPSEIREITTTWSHVFKAVAEIIIATDASEYRLLDDLAHHLAGVSRDEHTARWADRAGFGELKRTLYGLQLVEFETLVSEGPHPMMRSSYHRWHLTKYGQQQYGLLMGL